MPKKVQNGLTDPSDEESCLRDLLSMVSCLILLCHPFVYQPSHTLSAALSSDY